MRFGKKRPLPPGAPTLTHREYYDIWMNESEVSVTIHRRNRFVDGLDEILGADSRSARGTAWAQYAGSKRIDRYSGYDATGFYAYQDLRHLSADEVVSTLCREAFDRVYERERRRRPLGRHQEILKWKGKRP